MAPSVSEDLARFGRDRDYLEKHWAELRSQYPDQWVAILDGAVVGTSTNVERLLDDLESRGMPLERLVVEHIGDPDAVLILPG